MSSDNAASPFDLLPGELLYHVLINILDNAGRAVAYHVCSRWQSTIQDAFNLRNRGTPLVCSRAGALRDVLRYGLCGNIKLLEWLHKTAPLPESVECCFGQRRSLHLPCVGYYCARPCPPQWADMVTAAVRSGSSEIVQWVVDRRRDWYPNPRDEDMDALAARRVVAVCIASLGRVQLLPWLVYQLWPGAPSRSLYAGILLAAVDAGTDNRHQLAVVDWVLAQRHAHTSMVDDAVAKTLIDMVEKDCGAPYVYILAAIVSAEALVDAIVCSVTRHEPGQLERAMARNHKDDRECNIVDGNHDRDGHSTDANDGDSTDYDDDSIGGSGDDDDINTTTNNNDDDDYNNDDDVDDDCLAVPQAFIHVARHLRQDEIVAVIVARRGIEAMVPRGSIMPDTHHCLLVAFGHLKDQIDRLLEAC